MQTKKNGWILVSVLGLVALVGCKTEDPSVVVDDPDAGVSESGTYYHFVASEINIPTDTEDYALDIDEDGSEDNQLGELFNLLATYNFDMQGTIDEGIANGSVVVLHSIRADSLADDASASWQVFQGAAFAEGTFPDFSGTGAFSLDPESSGDAIVPGGVAGSLFEGGPAQNIELAVALVPGQPIVINLIGAHIEATVSDTACSGILAGALTEEELHDNIIPTLVTMMNGDVTGDETCFDESDVCQGADACTGDGAKFMLSFFDENEDCVIALEEVEENPVLQAALAPDLDLYDDTGAYNPNVDETADSLSLGFGIECVGAVFTVESEAE